VARLLIVHQQRRVNGCLCNHVQAGAAQWPADAQHRERAAAQEQWHRDRSAVYQAAVVAAAPRSGAALSPRQVAESRLASAKAMLAFDRTHPPEDIGLPAALRIDAASVQEMSDALSDGNRPGAGRRLVCDVGGRARRGGAGAVRRAGRDDCGWLVAGVGDVPWALGVPAWFAAHCGAGRVGEGARGGGWDWAPGSGSVARARWSMPGPPTVGL